ncbi:protein CASC1 [Anguilla anguilla]|uniref:protein CASC1 n=1 Tax=Anguilla anguilla TaxID=7936 RepID=UPI0015AE6333|nr:protein CASC1 [Anguilla anguilla]
MKKGGKVNKAEKAKALKEEQKRREKEEEELRLQREQEERERLERERKRQEKQEWLEKKDRERRGDELSELSQMLEGNYFAVTKWQAETKEKAKWERYMSCNGSPNPSIPQEVNAFINLWREDPEVQISPVMKDIAQALRLIEELECVLNDRGDSEQDEKDAQQDKETLLSLRNLVHSKLNLASEEILKWSHTNADMETGNMKKVIRDSNITLCLWSNLSKNARLKEIRFEDVGVAFELPKQLAVSDIAVRILHTRYDHLSPLSREVQRKEAAALAEEALLVAELEQVEQGEEEGTENGEADAQSVKSNGRKSSMSVASVKDRRSTVSQEPTLDEGENRTETPAEELATAVEEAPVNISPEPVANTPEVDFVDLYQYMPLGGVFYFEAFHLPPQSHLIKGWEMRKILDVGLQAFPYPPDQAQIQSSITKKEEPSSSPPVGITMTLPDSVIFLEDPMIACWDPTALQWRRDGAYEITYDAPTRTISFKMDSFRTFTFLQDSYANVPFQSWELRPLGVNYALLTIIAGLTEVSITIKDNKCMLTTDPRSELSHVSGKWMSVSSFQKALTSSGINIFVNEHSSKYVSITAKDPLTEQTAYEQMALMASTTAFSWSRWNSHCGQEHIVLQACQHLEEGPVPEEAWSLFLMGAQRSQCLEIKEWSDSFSPELADDTEFHSTFLHMLKESMTLAGWRRVQESHYLFTDCVHSLLCATRVLTYS